MRCAAAGCRCVDIVVVLRGPRGAYVPVCSRCWFSMPESGDTPESCARVDAWYDQLGAARPERRNWPPNKEREAARPVNAPTDSEDLGLARADVESGARSVSTSRRSCDGRAAGAAASRSFGVQHAEQEIRIQTHDFIIRNLRSRAEAT
jgi:hypothetical protein